MELKHQLNQMIQNDLIHNRIQISSVNSIKIHLILMHKPVANGAICNK